MKLEVGNIEATWTTNSDLHIKMPDAGAWWISYSRVRNYYFHEDEECKARLDRLKRKLGFRFIKALTNFENPAECRFCKRSIPDEVVLLLTLQRIKAKVPGPVVSL